MTWRDLLRSSFRLIGVLREGQGANGDDITDSLVVLNSMLASWSIDRLNVFNIRRDEYQLTASQQVYTIGTGGDFDTARPVRIDRAAVIYNGGAGGLNPEVPLKLLNDRDWENVTIKNLTSSIPTGLYSDNAYPLCNLNLWPVPTMDLPLILYTWAALAGGITSGDLDSDVVFPPGYEDAIRYNLAVRLAPEWDKKLRDDVVELARSSKRDIESLNAPAPTLRADAAMLNRGRRGGWNGITNDYRF